MRSSFRQLERRQVRYLLISGQAAVLYGASAFTEDVDLWVEPSRGNVEALITVAYWSPVLAELRVLRRTGGLLPEGSRP